MKLILLAFLAIATISFGQNYDQWKTYVSEEGHLSVSFPEQAAVLVEGEDGESPKTLKYQLEGDEFVYYAAVSIHESDLKETDEDLCQLSLDSFTQSVGGTIKNQSVWYVQGEEGIAAKMILSGKQVVYYKVVLKGNLQYQLVVLGIEDSKLVADKAEQFFKTFRLTE